MTDQSPIDWPSIRANAVAIGVREAARQAAINLPPVEQNRFVKRVLKRSEREGWIVRKNAVTAAAQLQHPPGQPHGVVKPMSSSVVNGADSMANHLAELGKRTKLNLVQSADKAAESFSKRSGEGIIADAQALRHVTAAAATLHGWQEGKTNGLTLNLGIMLGGMQ